MAKDLRELPTRSPADRAFNEAIELGIEGNSPYPERATFLDADQPRLAESIRQAIDEDMAVVLVYADGTTRILRAEPNGGEPRVS